MSSVFFIALRRLRAPLILIILIFAVATVGLRPIPGVDAEGKPLAPEHFSGVLLRHLHGDDHRFRRGAVSLYRRAAAVGGAHHLPVGDRLGVPARVTARSGPGQGFPAGHRHCSLPTRRHSAAEPFYPRLRPRRNRADGAAGVGPSNMRFVVLDTDSRGSASWSCWNSRRRAGARTRTRARPRH